MILINNYYKNHKILEISKELLELKDVLDFFSRKKLNFNNFYIPNFSINIVEKWFLEKNINLSKLPFIPFKTLLEFDNLYFKENIKDKIKNLNPFEIPIIYLNKRFDYGEFIPIYIGQDTNNLTLIYTEFKLSNKINILTPIIYGHEITHSILEKNQFSINDYVNYEILPMFIEKLLGNDLNYSKDLLLTIYLYRFKDLKRFIQMLENPNINNISRIHISTYINSLIISSQLFEVYIKESNKSKISTSINKILQDEMSIEELLNNLDITYESSLEKMLKFVKEGKFYV